MKLVVIFLGGVAWVLSTTLLFIILDRIHQESASSNYWKYLVGSDILATCCGWSARAALFHRSTVVDY